MDATWPFVVLTLGLFVGLCLTIASLERTGVMNRWSDRRCDLAVMVAAPSLSPTLIRVVPHSLPQTILSFV